MLTEAANSYLAAGLCVLPARRAEKRPALSLWKQYQQRLPTTAELSAWLAPRNAQNAQNAQNKPDAICILCGSISGNLEIIDFDAAGELFAAWWDRLPADLRERLMVEITPSGGFHAIYRCQEPICGNLKLAQRKVGGKVTTLIETRGEGGLFLCAPTLGYILAHGDLAALPVLTGTERDTLLQAAWELNEYLPPAIDSPHGAATTERRHSAASAPESADRPGDDFNRRGDPRQVLEQHGWVCVAGSANEYWRRPGKDNGWSATLKDRVFYVFSSNAAPFEPNRAYSPFAVYAWLEHGGDFEQAARTLRLAGYGSDGTNPGPDVDLSAIMQAPVEACASPAAPVTRSPETADPGAVPVEMLRMPGFVSEVMDYCLETAPYPSPVMAFGGALSLLAFLAGRKVCDPGDNRTNIYLLGLAHSAAGKDWPRKINTRVIHQAGLANCLGERFASGEGIQDALFQTPSMLFQTDEIDGILQSINKAKDARHEAIMSTLLTVFSSANTVLPMRRKAGASPGKPPGVIDQPNLVIFGTAIPNHYYEALSERMLTNGFFARMIILEAGPRGTGQEPSIRKLPPRVSETAHWWADFRPGNGNLEDFHPIPTVVEHSDEARDLLIEARHEAEAQYAAAEARNDSVGTTVWGRVSEQTRKLALLYAISENHKAPRISLPAVRWASQFVMHQTQRMLFMAAGHVAENPFHAECLKAIEKLRKAPGHELPHSVLLKRMKMDAKSFAVLIETLCQQGEVEAVTSARPGWHVRSYRLVGVVKPDGETSPESET